MLVSRVLEGTLVRQGSLASRVAPGLLGRRETRVTGDQRAWVCQDQRDQEGVQVSKCFSFLFFNRLQKSATQFRYYAFCSIDVLGLRRNFWTDLHFWNTRIVTFLFYINNVFRLECMYILVFVFRLIKFAPYGWLFGVVVNDPIPKVVRSIPTQDQHLCDRPSLFGVWWLFIYLFIFKHMNIYRSLGPSWASRENRRKRRSRTRRLVTFY